MRLPINTATIPIAAVVALCMEKAVSDPLWWIPVGVWSGCFILNLVAASLENSREGARD